MKHLTLTVCLTFLPLIAASVRGEDFVTHSFTKHRLNDQFWSEGANVGDFNRDGKLDIVSGPFWYAGPDFQQRFEIYAPKQTFKLKLDDGTEAVIPGFEGGLGKNNSYSDNFFAFTDDFNGDGWTDVLVYGFPGNAATWYENPKEEKKLWERHDVFKTVDNESPQWIDINGDGKRDILCGATLPTKDGDKGFIGYVTVNKANPAEPWTFHKISPPGGWGRFTHGIGAGDINGDGKTDILLANGWWEQPASLENDPEWKHHPAGFGGGGAQMYAYDVNGDGLNDVITSLQAHGYGLAWFEQYREGDEIKFKQNLIMGQEPKDNLYGIKFSQLHAIDLVDMDGDGLKDIVTGKRFWAHGPSGDPEPNSPAVVYWFQLSRSADRKVNWIPRFVDDDSGVGTQVVATDVNADGLPDIVVGNKKGTFVHLHAAKKVSREEWEKAQPVVRFPVEGAQVPAKPNDAGLVGVLPVGRNGKPVNTDFEAGDLRDWTATGDAFTKQPVEGDLIHARRPDMRSLHVGRFWIGGYEIVQDAGMGTLTSVPFKVTQPWAAFRIAGGGYENTRVELVRADTNQVFFKTTAFDPQKFQQQNNGAEEMRPVVVDLKPQMGQEIYIRVVDQQQGHWAHLNFDDFKFYAARPEFPDEYKPVTDGLKQLGAPSPAVPLDVVKHAGLSPEDAAKEMTVPPGFKVSLFAGEPDVTQPIAMAIDDRGRLWIAEAYSYPIRVPEAEAKDRILIFEDTDGDGKFDKRKVFTEGLNLVSGMEVGFGGVWVGAAPYFMFIPDKNGDDTPDGPPQILLDGWGSQDTHETLNSFNWGPDGWLYGCHGVFTHSRVGKPGTPDGDRIPINAGIWRYHPIKHTFEVFAQGTSNPWGVDFNERGQAFLTACVIPHLYHVIQNARYERQAGQHFNPYTYDDIKTIAVHRHYISGNPHAGNGRSDSAGGGHAHAGAMLYLGGSWPEKYRDQIFMNNIHGARINQDALSQKGSGYVGNRAPDFLLANDTWSQILYLTYGPDGSVYMIDWYDKNQCHHGNTAGHDRTNGRVFKVSYVGEDAAARPNTPQSVDLKKLSNEQLVEQLANHNDWHARHARRILQERAADRSGEHKFDASVEKLKAIALNPNDKEPHRLRALWALHSISALDETTLHKCLLSDNEYVRAWSIQLACENGRPGDVILAKFKSLAESDKSPVVRLYLASAVLRLPVPDRAGLIANLVTHGEDADDHNLPLLYWYASESLVHDHVDQAIHVYEQARIPLVRLFLVRRLSHTGDPKILARVIETALGKAAGDGERLAILNQMIEGLKGRRQVEMPATWPEAFAKLSVSPDIAVRSKAFGLTLTFGDPKAILHQRSVLMDDKQPASVRLDALNSLVSINAPDLAPSLQALIKQPDLQQAAIKSLAGFDDPKTPGLLLAALPDLPADARRTAFGTLASRPAYGLELLKAVEDKRLAAVDLSADTIRQLRNLKQREIDQLIQNVWGAVRDTPEEKLKEIARLKDMLAAVPKPENRPDVALGRTLFAKNCQQCHTLFAVGAKIGPDLTGSNRANVDYVLSNIVDPSAVIGKDYQAHIITTMSGRVLTGLIRNEDDTALTLVTATETIVLPKNEIDERVVSAKSMMPEDVVRQLSERDLRSLVAYLATPQQTQLLATVDTLKYFFNGKDLTGWRGDPELWSVQDGQIIGRTTGLNHNEFLRSELIAGDYHFACDVLLVRNEGNSGIQFRSEELPNGEVKGYQADIGAGWWGKLYEEHGRALLWSQSGEAHITPGEWTHYEIEAVGPHVKTWLNGKLSVDLDDPPGAKTGIIAFQLHSGGATEVRFKNLELKLIP